MPDAWTPANRPARFPGLGLCFYQRGPLREPQPGEFYAVQGQPIRQADRALQWRHRIVRPTHRAEARQVTQWRKGEPIAP